MELAFVIAIVGTYIITRLALRSRMRRDKRRLVEQFAWRYGLRRNPKETDEELYERTVWHIHAGKSYRGLFPHRKVVHRGRPLGTLGMRR